MGLHKWGQFEVTLLTEEVKGYYKKSIPVRVVTCVRCHLVRVGALT